MWQYRVCVLTLCSVALHVHVSEFTNLNNHQSVTVPHTGRASSKLSPHITAVQLSSASHFCALGCSTYIEDIANIDWGCFLSKFMLLTEGVIPSLFCADGTVQQEPQVTVVMKVRLRLVYVLTGLLMAFQCDVCSLNFRSAHGFVLCSNMWILASFAVLLDVVSSLRVI